MEDTKGRIYFCLENQDNKKLKTFNLKQDVFENILINFIENCPNFKERIHKNGYKIYAYKNIFFKIFCDGSCFVYSIKKQNIKKLNIPIDEGHLYMTITNTIQNKNDEFPGLKDYNFETNFEEIVLKLDEEITLIFSKNDKNEFAIFFEKSIKNDDLSIAHLTPYINLLFPRKTLNETT